MSQRVYVIGTNTEIGKTHFLQCVLKLARDRGVAALPFKPAQSGDLPFELSDAGRLMKAAGIPHSQIDLIALHRFNQDRAPGCIATPQAFTNPGDRADLTALEHAEETLRKLEQKYRPEWTFCEGAGGLQVPMPGGTWQLEWVRRLASHCIVVAPTGLGTINHSLLTIEAITTHLRVLGIAWTGAQKTPPQLAQENMKIVEARSKLARLAQPDERGNLRLATNFFETLAAKL